MEALKPIPDYTYDDYVHWEGRWELIEGMPFAMSPAPRGKHQWVAGNISSEFRTALKGCKACKAYMPIDYKIAENTVLQPDVLVVCGPIPKAFLDWAPALVVEVLSPSTASRDTVYKLNTYQTQGISYYLIVDAEKELIQIMELTNGHYELVAEDHAFEWTFQFPEGCEAKIDFNEVWS